VDFTNLLLLFGAGCLTGFIAGFFGVGGGIILVPILLYLFTEVLHVSSLVATHLTFGTSLLIVLLTSISSSYSHYRNGNVVPRAAVFVGLASIAAAFGGAWIAAAMQGKYLQQIFSVVLAFAALRLLMGTPSGRTSQDPNLNPGGLALIGVGAGLVSSLSGVGGGIVAVPLLHRFLDFPMRKAVGTSSAMIVLTALAGVAGYALNGLGHPGMSRYPYTLGFVDYLHSLPVIAGTIPMAAVGATAAGRTPNERLRKFFAILLLVVSARVFFLY
jgi:uncharacterized membrane protein YfcA